MEFATIGILGGGQLGRMLVSAAHRMGMRVAVLDPDPDSAAGQVADRQVVGDFRDPDRIRELAQGCDVLTVEIEHVDAETLAALEREGIPIRPSPETIRLIQDKYAQKQHFAAHGLPVPRFREIPDLDALHAAMDEFGLPLVLKSCRLAYDGRGNAVIRSRDEAAGAMAALQSSGGLYAEQFVPFQKELAVMVARGLDGRMVDYPVVETIQRDNICHTVLAPAPIPLDVQTNVQTVAHWAVASLGSVGIFGIELFLLPNGTILLNEVAPRPHNSGHYTIEACVTSQFEQHLRAILGMPLGDPALKVNAAAMVNVLGAPTLDETLRPLNTALALPGAAVHWYGKAHRPGRKLGHVTITGSSMVEVTERLAAITDTSDIKVSAAPLVGIIMGSDSDLPVMKQAAQVLRDFGVPFELTIVSAHRTPQRMFQYAQSAHQRGLRAIIAGAGGAAHLPGMVAALTPLPVIGVPVRVEPLDGQDSLLSIVQMPRGVPVATVAIGNATNAGLLAVRLLASSDPALLARMINYQQALESSVLDKAASLERDGWENYQRA